MASKPEVQIVSAELHAVPLTLEGLSVLHQMFRFRWPEWRKLDAGQRAERAHEVAAAFGELESAGQFAAYSMLGHKGDLMLVHFRDSFDDLNQAELTLDYTGMCDFLEPVHSYVSVIELGLYDSSLKLFRQLAERGVATLSDQWNKEVEETVERQTTLPRQLVLRAYSPFTNSTLSRMNTVQSFIVICATPPRAHAQRPLPAKAVASPQE